MKACNDTDESYHIKAMWSNSSIKVVDKCHSYLCRLKFETFNAFIIPFHTLLTYCILFYSNDLSLAASYSSDHYTFVPLSYDFHALMFLWWIFHNQPVILLLDTEQYVRYLFIVGSYIAPRKYSYCLNYGRYICINSVST